MTDLLSAEQVAQIRSAMTDIADTFAFPITLQRTTYTDGAFASSANVNGAAASGTITYGTPANGDTLTVSGVNVFTKVAAPGPLNGFSNITELTTLINAVSGVDATDDGTTITVVASSVGAAGNAITLASTGSSLDLSGATLTGGIDSGIFSLAAIRSFGSSGESGRFRNPLGVAAAGEFDLYIGWQSLEDNNLIDGNDLALIDNNDVVEMEGEIYEIVAFAGIADMTKRPSFLQLRVKRRWQGPNGALQA